MEDIGVEFYVFAERLVDVLLLYHVSRWPAVM